MLHSRVSTVDFLMHTTQTILSTYLSETGAKVSSPEYKDETAFIDHVLQPRVSKLRS